MSDNLGLVRVGIVTAADADKVMVRVTFDDLSSDDTEGLLSDWLPVIQHGSTADSGYWLPNVGAQVIVAMQSNALECGYVIGTVYNDEDVPEASGVGRWYRRFADGTVIEYDPAVGVKIDTPLDVIIQGANVRMN